VQKEEQKEEFKLKARKLKIDQAPHLRKDHTVLLLEPHMTLLTINILAKQEAITREVIVQEARILWEVV
jgi:hypothetical protein